MVKKYKRRWQLSRVRPGDGSPLADYRLWQLFTRSLFFLDGDHHHFAVDVRYLVDAKTKRQHEKGEGKSQAALYRDGVQLYRANLPTTFPVPGGVIEVASTAFGLKRIHFVSEDGRERALRPHERSQEGLRARFERRFPRTSSVIGALAVVVLLGVLTVALLKGVEALSRVPVIAEHIGTFTSPVSPPVWAATALTVAGVLAAVERATRLKYHWLLDSAAS